MSNTIEASGAQLGITQILYFRLCVNRSHSRNRYSRPRERANKDKCALADKPDKIEKYMLIEKIDKDGQGSKTKVSGAVTTAQSSLI